LTVVNLPLLRTTQSLLGAVTKQRPGQPSFDTG